MVLELEKGGLDFGGSGVSWDRDTNEALETLRSCKKQADILTLEMERLKMEGESVAGEVESLDGES
jgi:hypothetical protein